MAARLAPVSTWADHRREMGKGSKADYGISSTELSEAVKHFEATQLKPKRMQERCLVELHLNFSKDPDLLERYIATSGAIRMGKIFEDLDTLAGAASYMHVLGHLPIRKDRASPLFIVTASVDRLDLVKPLVITSDYRLTGSVIYVGSSSMEVLVAIEEIKADSSPSEICLTGRFTMAARNAATLRSQRIAPLQLETKAEERLFQLGQQHKMHKQQSSATSLERSSPTEEEALLLHDVFLRDRNALTASAAKAIILGSSAKMMGSEEEVVSLSSTMHSSTLHMHPQQANVHLNVFGGVLMRHCYELGWITASIFANAPVEFLALDALSFHSPVPIGAVLNMTSTVTYTSQGEEKENAVAAVNVVAEIVDIESGKRKKSNTFHFSFSVGQTKRRVSPLTYADAIEWLESRRRVQIGDQLREEFKASAISPTVT
ncbi:Thioesterase/thiol ester dehydrase-isomerase [Tilletiaria anomala UBC 951]|uniref:Thioesterase/thiol ester dehydrase-isomerase n=1 Tax=Tilletiaria anomala (strain ATCC 24038 / CBS 436.72 / UBC 951) TaxID=1037660 RepID=A0A066VTE3_TILAU|nr:Thioesterase/thiol ester dehydrase-isomerase [Tilletiaria anomala UBC 951]KDN43543.1 Thioesterase/thiol ester dehydrase-isomerase [Tilletiaria anomala UBC 951]